MAGIKAICYDLYCGLGGWTEGFLSEGFKCIGFDTVAHDYGDGGYPGELIIRDVRSIHGSELKDGAVIVASPPCQEPSYRAMPWKRAKQLNAAGPPHNFIALFDACFRIQREASEAAGKYIPLIVENVVGAQRWVGQARWHFGSYYLWGDVPALMPIARSHKFNPDGTGHPPGSWFAIADSKNRGSKSSGQDWNRYKQSGEVSPHWLMEAVKVSSNCSMEGVKQRGSGREWFAGEGKISRETSSKSRARARASAEIAKIPFALSSHIAKCFKPRTEQRVLA